MALLKFGKGEFEGLERTTFVQEGIQERQDLQEGLKKNISSILPDCLVIAEEFSYWEDSRRRIDLLAVDKDANLVVIELKRDETGVHMELQALRYASMISPLTYEQACDYYQNYLDKNDIKESAEQNLLDFLEWSEPEKDDFAQDVRIVLVSADFSKELTTAILWLRDKAVDITCIRLSPYKYANDVFINAEQIIPVPETEEYLIKLKSKKAEQQQAVISHRDRSKYRFKGQIYNKRNLALEILKVWIEQNQPRTLENLLEVFNTNIHREIAREIKDVPPNLMKRFHSQEENLIELPSSQVITITNQWGIDTITALISRVERYGFNIEKIEQ